MYYDGNISFAGGQSSGLLADRIAADQFAKGINVTTKNGALSPRLRMVQVPLRFRDRSLHEKYWLSLRRGKFQCAVHYRSDAGVHQIVVINGIIFAVNPISGIVDEVKIKHEDADADDPPDRINPLAKRVNFAKAGRFLVLFDWPRKPVILDGLEARRASFQSIFRVENNVTTEFIIPEVPPSRIGVFVQNRLFVANGGHEFGAGDPVGGINRDAPITFEESLVSGSPYNGQFFSLGTTNINNPITYMGYLQSADTSTGYGPLVVATDEAVYTFRANEPREQWEAEQFGSLSLYNAGIVGPRACVNVNSDMLFMSADGQIRSLHMGRDEQTRWGNTPISREVSDWLVAHDSRLLGYAVAESFDNRVFFTANPFRCKALMEDGKTECLDCAFHGLVVLELDNMSGMLAVEKPAWAGLWQGIFPMDISQGDWNGERMLHVWSKDPGGINNLYWLTDQVEYDVFEGNRKPVVSRVYTKLYDFDARFRNKKLRGLDMKVSDIRGDFAVLAEYRGSIQSEFAKWRLAGKAIATNCEGLPKGSSPSDLAAGFFRELHLGSPEETLCEPLTGELSNSCRSVQARLSIRGAGWMIEDIRITADESENEGRISHDVCKSTASEASPGDYVTAEKPCSSAFGIEADDDWNIHIVPIRQADPEPCEPCACD